MTTWPWRSRRRPAVPSHPRPQPSGLTVAEQIWLGELAERYAGCPSQLADALRCQLPELGDVTLARLLLTLYMFGEAYAEGSREAGFPPEVAYYRLLDRFAAAAVDLSELARL